MIVSLFFSLFFFPFYSFHYFLPFLIYKLPFLLSRSFLLPLLLFQFPPFFLFSFFITFFSFSVFPRFPFFLFASFAFYLFSLSSFAIHLLSLPSLVLEHNFIVAIISLRCILTKSIKVLYSTALDYTVLYAYFYFYTSVLGSPCSLLNTKKLISGTIYFNLRNTLQHTGLIESYGMMCCT